LEELDNSNRSQIEFNINDELITELETLKDEYRKTKELNTSLNNQLQDQIKYSQNSLEQYQQGIS
jgi:rRNA-processing protein FCF1